jgi:hypothetical protein
MCRNLSQQDLTQLCKSLPPLAEWWSIVLAITEGLIELIKDSGVRVQTSKCHSGWCRSAQVHLNGAATYRATDTPVPVHPAQPGFWSTEGRLHIRGQLFLPEHVLKTDLPFPKLLPYHITEINLRMVRAQHSWNKQEMCKTSIKLPAIYTFSSLESQL